jgi:hypothetical protein
MPYRPEEVRPIIRKIALVSFVYTIGIVVFLLGIRPPPNLFVGVFVVTAIMILFIQFRLIREVRAIMKGNP